jgi:hypothetical protein
MSFPDLGVVHFVEPESGWIRCVGLEFEVSFFELRSLDGHFRVVSRRFRGPSVFRDILNHTYIR